MGSRSDAQREAERLRRLREELGKDEIRAVLALTAEQHAQFERWCNERLEALAREYDVDTTASQERVSWGMRIAAALGAIAFCVAVVLFARRFWGYLWPPVQLVLAMAIPLAALAGTEIVSRRERSPYFTNLLAAVTLAGFFMNLVIAGGTLNIAGTGHMLVALAALALVLAYRYGLRLMLAAGLFLAMSYLAAVFTARFGYNWADFGERPENFLLLGGCLFVLPVWLKHRQRAEFVPVFRLVGALTFFTALFSVASTGLPTYLPWTVEAVERVYGIAGLWLSTAAIWLGVGRGWRGVANTGTGFFVAFLFVRLFQWLWDEVPRYAFFALIGALSVALVIAFQQTRARLAGVRQ